jgi:hypothetical protein
MDKIRIDVDALEVESFATAERGAKERGTVRGHDYSYPNWDCPFSWGNLGCQSISGEVVCECAPDETFEIGRCV